MSGLDGSSIKQKSQCAAGLPGRSHLSECRSEACVERWVHDIFHLFIIVPVAQPDRVSDSDSEGQGFESLRVRHEKSPNFRAFFAAVEILLAVLLNAFGNFSATCKKSELDHR